MPSKESEPRIRRGSGKYAPAISNPVIDAVADIAEGKIREDLRDVVQNAVARTKGRYELGLLFGDLICCGLNGDDYLLLLAGMIQSNLAARPAGEESNPGKYDRICRQLQEDVQADAILMVVLNGIMGSGFSVGIDTDAMDPKKTVAQIPAMLRQIANSIESQQEVN